MKKTMGPGNFHITSTILLLWHCRMTKTMGPGNFNTTIVILFDEQNLVARKFLILLVSQEILILHALPLHGTRYSVHWERALGIIAGGGAVPPRPPPVFFRC